MKKYMRMFLLLYFAGFAAGVLCADLLQKKTGYQTSLLPVYLTASDVVWKNQESLFGTLLARRGILFLCGIVCGLTLAGVPLVVLALLWFGFLAGNLCTLFLLEYGIKGLGIGAACFLPHAFFYVPGWMVFFFVVFQMSQKCWGKGKREKADYKAYFFFLSGAGVFLLLGIWMESYVNQNLLSYLLSKWI